MNADAVLADLIEAAEHYRQVMRVRDWKVKSTREVWQSWFGLPVYATVAEIKNAAHFKLISALERARAAA